MTRDLTLEAVDRDGALQETMQRAGSTRAAFLVKAAAASGGLVGGGALLAGLVPATAAAQGLSQNDTDILNFALTLEYLEAAFYAEAIAKGALRGKALDFARVAGAHEATHVSTLKTTLGSAAIASPTFDFKGTTSDQASFLTTAITLEDTGVAAYKGQAPLLKSTKVLAAALSIHTVEAKHAGWVRHVAGQSPVITAADQPKTKPQVLAAVMATGFITG